MALTAIRRVLLCHCIVSALPSFDFHHDPVRQADYAFVGFRYGSGLYAYLVFTGRICHLRRAVFYGNLICVAVSLDGYFLIVRKRVCAVDFAVHGYYSLCAAGGGKDADRRQCDSDENENRQKDEISFFKHVFHQNS